LVGTLEIGQEDEGTARKMKEWWPPGYLLLTLLPLLPELLEALPEVPLLKGLPLLDVLPEVLVKPSEKVLLKRLLGIGLWWKGPSEWRKLLPQVMVLNGGAQLPGLLWMVFTEGLLRMASYTGLLAKLCAAGGWEVGTGWLVGAEML
jgi:hypothetical protein